MSLNAANKLWPDRQAVENPPPKTGPAGQSDAPAGAFENFVEACDRAVSPGEVERLFLAAARQSGFERVALTTHAPPAELGRLGICTHNWGARAIQHLHDGAPDRLNPLFELAELCDEPVHWSAPEFRAHLDAEQVRWMDQLAAIGLKDGVTQRIRTAMAPASCSMVSTWGGRVPAGVQRIMRMAGYALNTILALRRSQDAASDLLTRRERQCLSLAVFSGLRPREVADALGVSVNTVRSIRQSATARLGARSQEETVWRLIETGQLFFRGRPNRPRSR